MSAAVPSISSKDLLSILGSSEQSSLSNVGSLTVQRKDTICRKGADKIGMYAKLLKAKYRLPMTYSLVLDPSVLSLFLLTPARQSQSLLCPLNPFCCNPIIDVPCSAFSYLFPCPTRAEIR